MDLCNPKEIKALLGRHGFRFSKQMGQNFLIQEWVPRQTAEASGAAPGVGVLEIGPGIGPLTAQLARRGEKVVSVELDRTLLPILAETLSDYDNVEIVPGDILKTDIAALCRERMPGLPVVACANLPYNITTPVITALLQAQCFQAVTVMIQREVAQRICAQPGTPEYGPSPFSASITPTARCCMMCLPPVFFPPQGDLHGDPYDNPGKAPGGGGGPGPLFQVVRAAFAQRRKTLVNCLYPLLEKSVEKQTLSGLLHACNLTETIRGERLTFADFAQLTGKLKEIRGS